MKISKRAKTKIKRQKVKKFRMKNKELINKVIHYGDIDDNLYVTATVKNFKYL